MRLQHVSVPMRAGGEDEARAFYCDVLGLSEKQAPASLGREGFVWLEAGEGELEIHLFADAEPAHARQHFALAVDDLGAVRERLRAAGNEPAEATPIRNRPRFFCHDPFGNRVELTTIAGDYRGA